MSPGGLANGLRRLLAGATPSSRWIAIISAVAVLGVALVLSFLLSEATNNRRFYDTHYQWLLWVNLGVAGLLGAVILTAVIRLGSRLARGKFGSRLLLKLAGIFGLVGLVPGLVIYTVSYQFVSRSIENWFDVQVEGALDAGLQLGRESLDNLSATLTERARLAADRIADDPSRRLPSALESVREQLAAQSVAVLDALGRPQASASEGLGAAGLAPRLPSGTELREARSAGVWRRLEGLDDETAAEGQSATIRVVVWMPPTRITLDAQDRYLLVTQTLPAPLSAQTLAVQKAYREYQERALARTGLKQLYISTLTLTLVMAVFAALLLAATLGRQLARPLLLLAQGVRDVAGGDLSPKPVFASRDELGGLTRSFADMTQQLADARQLVQRSLVELDAARAGVQTILDNLTSGVLLLDRDGRVQSANPSAARILKVAPMELAGQVLGAQAHLSAFAEQVKGQISTHEATLEPDDHWQTSLELRHADGTEPLALLMRGAPMPQGRHLLVLDDITELVSAQRSEAWGEVARRLAHEIKNPLTPIQLSAERLQMKLEPRLQGSDQQLLSKSVATIVAQVQSMKTLVNEFRDYARLPAAQLHPIDLNALITDVLVLYGQALESHRLSIDLQVGLPAIMGDATQLRQVIHNLVQNALDAIAEREDGQAGILTDLVYDEQHLRRWVRLRVVDNGAGFADKVLKRAFEPYVTTKLRGTGLGLALVKKIADEHGARVRLSNRMGLPEGGSGTPTAAGAQVSLSFSRLATDGDETASGAGTLS